MRLKKSDDLARARENGVELYAALSRIVRAYMHRVPAGSDAMVAAMKILDKTDGGNRYQRAKAEQDAWRKKARSANAGKPLPVNDPREEHQTTKAGP